MNETSNCDNSSDAHLSRISNNIPDTEDKVVSNVQTSDQEDTHCVQFWIEQCKILHDENTRLREKNRCIVEDTDKQYRETLVRLQHHIDLVSGCRSCFQIIAKRGKDYSDIESKNMKDLKADNEFLRKSVDRCHTHMIELGEIYDSRMNEIVHRHKEKEKLDKILKEKIAKKLEDDHTPQLITHTRSDSEIKEEIASNLKKIEEIETRVQEAEQEQKKKDRLQMLSSGKTPNGTNRLTRQTSARSDAMASRKIPSRGSITERVSSSRKNSKQDS